MFDLFNSDVPKPQRHFKEPVDNSNAPWQPKWAVQFQARPPAAAYSCSCKQD